MQTALIVIDAQESFRHRPYFSSRDVSAYLAAQNALVEQAQRRGVPIVRVFHVETGADNPFSMASGYVRPFEGLADFQEAAAFHKSRHSALVGSGLDVWLTENGIREIVVSGIRTEQCCETTTRHASDLGYRVRYVPDATLTFDMELADGSRLTAAEIKHRTAAVLDGRFATICTVEEAYATAHPH
jgi:nicotinamidase-related amidase